MQIYPRGPKHKKVTGRHRGWGVGGRGIDPSPLLLTLFLAIHPIDLIFDTFNEFSLYFQLIETTW